ncbi:hypothetical protein PTSG_09117 [Salpingoeca rosetta]|uniref:Centrosomal protein POC5 n=1 Tax=Salpingoeca rosetta (strain ATCC 50818 / BSB-021) TaxID=946362 RepID=F2UMS2_SALR5|nr:uncharacterized protein PTSG_09117 [Salpingoeca rosetta]EGD78421.1 hypothetical protein PTSG_09117 [Salpingoeca rosetta]|eukprot:XP_004989370.1 hypothetical protein PTSG_09117 [Salpingoeca rosetta]
MDSPTSPPRTESRGSTPAPSQAPSADDYLSLLQFTNITPRTAATQHLERLHRAKQQPRPLHWDDALLRFAMDHDESGASDAARAPGASSSGRHMRVPDAARVLPDGANTLDDDSDGLAGERVDEHNTAEAVASAYDQHGGSAPLDGFDPRRTVDDILEEYRASKRRQGDGDNGENEGKDKGGGASKRQNRKQGQDQTVTTDEDEEEQEDSSNTGAVQTDRRRAPNLTTFAGATTAQRERARGPTSANRPAGRSRLGQQRNRRREHQRRAQQQQREVEAAVMREQEGVRQQQQHHVTALLRDMDCDAHSSERIQRMAKDAVEALSSPTRDDDDDEQEEGEEGDGGYGGSFRYGRGRGGHGGHGDGDGGGNDGDGARDAGLTHLEAAMKSLCNSMKTHLFSEYGRAKSELLLSFERTLEKERAEHQRQRQQLTRELEGLRDLVSTYETHLRRKDDVIANTTNALASQREKMRAQKSLAQWHVQAVDQRRAAFTSKIACKHARRQAMIRAFRGWRSVIENKWRQRIERSCRLRAEEICHDMSAEYEDKLKQVRAQLLAAQAEVEQSRVMRAQQEERMKKAFMRGVCALNMEAMEVFDKRAYDNQFQDLQQPQQHEFQQPPQQHFQHQAQRQQQGRPRVTLDTVPRSHAPPHPTAGPPHPRPIASSSSSSSSSSTPSPTHGFSQRGGGDNMTLRAQQRRTDVRVATRGTPVVSTRHGETGVKLVS